MMTSDSQSDLKIVTTPTFEWLAENARQCRHRMLIASPFVNSGVIQVMDLTPGSVTRSLITRTDLRDFATGASSLEALCMLAERTGWRVSSLNGLHAKMYIFDDTCALVTSANATNSGLRRNLECGLATRDSRIVAQLSRTLLRGFDSEVPRLMSAPALERLKLALSSVKASMPQNTQVPVLDAEPEFSVTDDAALLAGFRGWTNLTLRGVLALPPGNFELEELVRFCEPLATRRIPEEPSCSGEDSPAASDIAGTWDCGVCELPRSLSAHDVIEAEFSAFVYRLVSEITAVDLPRWPK